jgi:DNA-directed RNA polymerase specialized sigma24 family protein
MDRAEAVARLPTTYAAVIELLDQGASEEVIAERLDVDRAAVAPLVAVARAKLSRILDDAARDPGPTDDVDDVDDDAGDTG